MENEEQSILALRAELERQARLSHETDERHNKLLNEISRINNELMNMQRTLAKTNTGLLQLNQKLQKEQEKSQALLNQLEQSNQTLQDFTAIASHDLQAPLRKVETFADYLQTECGDALSDRGRDYLKRIQNAALHMRAFVTNLLELSRVTTQAQVLVPVDLTELAREVVTDLEVQVQECGGQVEISEMPTVQAEPLQMRQLLQNLISNALKFRREGVPPKVSISAKSTSPEKVVLTVQDNGIGFDEKHLKIIFTPFQRLHGRSKYEGTGIGLAICHKIVERHGGDMTAKSVVGRGTTFIVTLPQIPDQGIESAT